MGQYHHIRSLVKVKPGKEKEWEEAVEDSDWFSDCDSEPPNFFKDGSYRPERITGEGYYEYRTSTKRWDQAELNNLIHLIDDIMVVYVFDASSYGYFAKKNTEFNLDGCNYFKLVSKVEQPDLILNGRHGWKHYDVALQLHNRYHCDEGMDIWSPCMFSNNPFDTGTEENHSVPLEECVIGNMTFLIDV